LNQAWISNESLTVAVEAQRRPSQEKNKMESGKKEDGNERKSCEVKTRQVIAA
jgi:hypothetical protein